MPSLFLHRISVVRVNLSKAATTHGSRCHNTRIPLAGICITYTHGNSAHCILFFFFLRFNLLILRERRREEEREGENNQCLVASCAPPTRYLAHSPGMCPHYELNQQPFGLQASTQSTEPHQPELPIIFFTFALCRWGKQDKLRSNLIYNKDMIVRLMLSHLV